MLNFHFVENWFYTHTSLMSTRKIKWRHLTLQIYIPWYPFLVAHLKWIPRLPASFNALSKSLERELGTDLRQTKKVKKALTLPSSKRIRSSSARPCAETSSSSTWTTEQLGTGIQDLDTSTTSWTTLSRCSVLPTAVVGPSLALSSVTAMICPGPVSPWHWIAGGCHLVFSGTMTKVTSW